MRIGSRLLFAAAALALGVVSVAGAADKKTIERGKYLVNLGGCFDCHTPGYFLGVPHEGRAAGSGGGEIAAIRLRS